MKWALLILACVCLFMCYRVGAMAAKVDAGSGTIEHLMTVEAAAASTYTGGAIGAGIIGAASAIGAAWIQAADNKKKV